MRLVVKNIIIMCLLSVVFSLFGCSPQPAKTVSEISSISITQNHMNRAYCYAFSAYEDNDKYFFNAWCVLKDGENGSKEVDIQNSEITEAEFSEFARLNEKYGFVKSCIVQGIIWAFWHTVLWFVDSDFMGLNMIPYIISNVIVMTGLCFLINLVMNRYNNLLYAIAIHFCFNFLYCFLKVDILFYVILSAVYVLIIAGCILFEAKSKARCNEQFWLMTSKNCRSLYYEGVVKALYFFVFTVFITITDQTIIVNCNFINIILIVTFESHDCIFHFFSEIL